MICHDESMKSIRTIAYLALLSCLASGCQVGRRYGEGEQFAVIDDIVAEEIEAGHIPGAVVLVGQADRILYWEAFGYEVTEPYREPMTRNTVFDLASLTKPIATATSVLILADRGQLDVNDLVSVYLPAFGCKGKEEVQIRHLLTHTSGLPAYTNAEDLESRYGRPCPDKVVEKICSLDALSQPGEQFHYSCLGYIILAEIVKVVAEQDVGEFSRQNIFRPLGMRRTAFHPPASWHKNIAATQIVKGQLLRGAVHDPLAQLMDGMGGNAGLFGSARDLAIYCRMLLNGGTLKGRTVLGHQAATLLTAAQSHGRAFGFGVSSSYSWVKGPRASQQAFFHTGYTGTSIVCDPTDGVYLIILTNRVHPHDEGVSKAIRTKIAETVFQAFDP